MDRQASAKFPDGIGQEHIERPRLLGRRANPLPLIALAALLIVAALGVFGSGVNETWRAAEADAELSVNMPARIRNGEFFETRIVVTPHRAFADLVVAIEPSLWRDVTINTFIPAPAEEDHDDGAFRFSYGEWEAGAPLQMKIDGQINPSLFGGTAGRVQLYDGDALVAELPIEMRVWP